MSLLNKIKEDAKKAGSNKGKFFFVREGEKRRIRFLSDMDDGIEISFHDSFEKGINQPCQVHFNRECEYCEQEGFRTRSQYAWSVWDYDAKEVKLLMFPINNCTPISAFVSFYENYGTLTDRDYVLSVSGKKQNKSFSVVPMDKAKFRNDKAKPLSQKTILQTIDKAYPSDTDTEDDDDIEEAKPTKAKKTTVDKGVSSKGDNSTDYEDMTAKELFTLCSERDIKAKPKKDEDYYIGLLLKYDEEQAEDTDEEGDEDTDEEGDEDDRGEDEETPDYSEMDAKELYKLCKEKDIDAEPKKTQKYYIKLLEENEQAQDDWGDDEE